MPELPAGDPTFAALGGSFDAERALRSLWHEWHLQVSHGWLTPHEYDFLAYKLGERLGNKREGRDELNEWSRRLLNAWYYSPGLLHAGLLSAGWDQVTWAAVSRAW
jgi:hypothetical protein